MSKQSRPKMSREDENYLQVKSQYMGAFETCRKYGYKSKDSSHIVGANAPKFNYFDKPGHVNKYF